MNNTKIADLNRLDDYDQEQDIELEEEESESPKPYNPALIRVETKQFSLRNIMDMVEEGDIDLAPDFQRLNVWKPKQKSRLIESVMLRIPLPAFYFSTDEKTGGYQVVDGVQRLSTIYNFVRGNDEENSIHKRFALSELEYLGNDLDGKMYSDIEGTLWSKRILTTQIVANVIDPQTPSQVKFDIFKRINTGGSPLTLQEIRHCMSKEPSRTLLKELSQSDVFNKATGGKISGNIRMDDREMILRSLAFYLLGFVGYTEARSLDEFLMTATQQLDAKIPKDLKNRFLKAVACAEELFGEHAFRKWGEKQTRRSLINKALFESITATLMKADQQKVLENRDHIVKKFQKKCDADYDFMQSISQSTASISKVKKRFEVFEELFGVKV